MNRSMDAIVEVRGTRHYVLTLPDDFVGDTVFVTEEFTDPKGSTISAYTLGDVDHVVFTRRVENAELQYRPASLMYFEQGGENNKWVPALA